MQIAAADAAKCCSGRAISLRGDLCRCGSFDLAGGTRLPVAL
jgi:hypothetical protein